MSIIDCEAFKRDGMKAYENALLALEAAVEAQARDLNGLYAAQGYQNDRRKDERAIRNEIDGRLRVVEEQVTRMAEALRAAQVELETLHRDVAELTTDTQTDLRILQARTEAQQCAVCGKAGDSKLCPECRADVRAGIEDAGLAGMRVRRPESGVIMTGTMSEDDYDSWYAPGIPLIGQGCKGYFCLNCNAAVVYESPRALMSGRVVKCEICGHKSHRSMRFINSLHTRAAGWEVIPDNLPVTTETVRWALRGGNGADHDGEMA